MKPAKSLWRIRIAVTPECEEAVTSVMEEILGQSASVHVDVLRDRSWATVYLPRPSDWNAPRKSRLIARLREISALGIRVPRIHVAAARLADEDWAESWKRHFKPLEIGGRLLLLPSWSRRKPGRDQVVVTLDPGLSFGTGQHPTTRFCLEELLAARLRRWASSLLDVGCGSGILAIAAARLGYERVEAFDFDADAVRIAGENAEKNGVRGRVKPSRRDLTRLPDSAKETFDVVCANLTSDLLVSEARKLRNRVAPGGTLVLAGVLSKQFRTVQQTFAGQGFKLRRSRRQGEWESGAFRV